MLYPFVNVVAALMADGGDGLSAIPSAYGMWVYLSAWFSIPALLIAGPLAFSLARALRGTTNRWTHGATFALCGGVVGAVASLFSFVSVSLSTANIKERLAVIPSLLVGEDSASSFFLAAALTCAATVCCGWLRTMNRMLNGHRSNSLVTRIEHAIDEATRAEDVDTVTE